MALNNLATLPMKVFFVKREMFAIVAADIVLKLRGRPKLGIVVNHNKLTHS
jgi:hypothetical protein